MKRYIKIVLAAVSAVAIASTSAVAAGDRHSDRSDRLISKMTKKLDLNEQQVSDLESLRKEFLETRELMHGNLETDGHTLGDLMGAETFDQGAALEMITTRTTALQTKGPELVAAMGQFLDSLTAEQKQIFSEQIDKFSQRRGKRRHGKGN